MSVNMYIYIYIYIHTYQDSIFIYIYIYLNILICTILKQSEKTRAPACDSSSFCLPCDIPLLRCLELVPQSFTLALQRDRRAVGFGDPVENLFGGVPAAFPHLVKVQRHVKSGIVCQPEQGRRMFYIYIYIFYNCKSSNLG